MGVVANNTRRIMRERGLLHKYVADKAGLDEKIFSALLTERKIMREEHILSIAQALNVAPNDLLTETEVA